MEQLEARHMLAAPVDCTVVINELMYHPASDDGNLEWIELYNQMAVDMDLSGWRLDGAVKFTFPSTPAPGTVLHGGSYLVIAANPAALQAATGLIGTLGPFTGNLSNGGETVTLLNNNDRLMDEVKYNDRTPWPEAADGSGASLSKYDPMTTSGPAGNWRASRQVGGTPGAINFAETTGPVYDSLLAPGATARVLVPTNGDLGDTWFQETFDASAWTLGSTGVGYDTDPGGGGNPVRPQAYWNFDDNTNDTSGNGHNAVNNGAVYSTTVPPKLGTGKSLSFNGTSNYVSALLDVSEASYTCSLWFKSNGQSRGIFAVVDPDLGSNGHDRHIYLTGTNLGTRLWNTEVLTTSGKNYVDGQWHNVVYEYGAQINGERIYVDGQQVVSGSKSSSDFNWQTRVNIGFSNDATNTYFSGLIDDVAIWDSVLTDTQIQSLANGTSPLAVGGYKPLIKTDVQTTMYTKNATAYARVPFTVSNPALYDQLTLSVQYDDGFVAYLNGTKVAWKNAPASPVWNSTATAEHPDAQAVQFESIDLTSRLGLLHAGTNVLAIQALNLTASDSDFLIVPQIAARQAVAGSEDLAFSEVAAAGVSPWWIELRNFGPTPLPLQGHVLRTGAGQEYTFPADAPTLQPGDYRALDSTQLGFQAAAGEKLFLYGAGKARVLDAATVDSVVRGRAAANPTGQMLYPDSPTPGAANTFALHDQIVINEIMYHHPPIYGAQFTEVDEEWIELYNRSGAAVDLSGWKLDSAVNFTFPAGTVLEADHHLVVTSNSAVLRAKFPDATIVGDFSGVLSNVDDDILLLDAAGNPADEVHYYAGAPWPQWPDGGGASLELRNPWADNSRAEAWTSSVTPAAASWQRYSYTAAATEQPTSYSQDPNDYGFYELRVGLLSEGEALIDNVSVVEIATGRELIQNGSFTTGADKWRLLGTQEDSHVIDSPDAAHPGKVLDVVATDAASYLNNLIETTLKYGGSVAPVVTGRQYRISFDAKWVRGTPQLHAELYYNRVTTTALLAMPSQYGTPGARNSTWAANVGPTYSGLLHAPAVPKVNEAISVSVAASDPDGIASMALKWRPDGGAWQNAVMTLGSDGRYRATIPGQSTAGAVLQFYVQGVDALGGASGTSTYPAAGAESRALIKVDDGRAMAGKQNFRMILTSADATRLHETLNILNDSRMGATIVYNEREIFYDAGVRLRGSMFSRQSPSTVPFNIHFPADHLFRGVQAAVTVDRPTIQEILVKNSMVHAGLPGMYDDIVNLISYRTDNVGMARLGLTRYGDTFLDSQYENGSDGMLFKMEGIRVFTQTSDGTAEGIKQPFSGIGWVGNYDIANLGSDKEQYRWSLSVLNNSARDDYSRIIAMAQGWSLSGQALQNAVAATMDVDEWMRAFAMTSLWGIGDMYTQGNPHNLDMYVRPSDGKIMAFPWDMDFVANYGATSPLYNLQAGFNLGRIIDLPVYRRLYYGNLLDLINTTYNTTYLNPWITSYGQTAGQSFSSLASYVNDRSTYVRSQMPAAVTFAITSPNGGNNFSVNDVKTTLGGNGWIDVDEVRLAGHNDPLPVVWTNFSTWQVTLPLVPGANAFTLQAYNRQGQLVGTDSITVTSTAPPSLLQQYLRITELNYNPTPATADEIAQGFTDQDFEFIELTNTSATQSLNLQGVNFTAGVTFSFTTPVDVPAGSRILLVKSQTAFEYRYGIGLRPQIAGVFTTGSLSNSGEPIALVDGVGLLLADFTYGVTGLWPGRANGNGSTLEPVSTSGDYNDPGNWQSSIQYNGTPGAPSAVADVVVNEVLTHTDQPLVDAIELYNTTGNSIDISGWWLSDSNADYFKFRIPDGTTMAAGSYLLFYEGHWEDNTLAFATNSLGQYIEFGGGTKGFGLNSAHGDDVYLVQSDASGNITRFADHAGFGAAANGESWGRWQDDQGRWHFSPMLRPTLDAPGNSNTTDGNGPRTGSLVISEVMYAPKPLVASEQTAGFTDQEDMEFVEIHNPTAATVDLVHWHLDKGITFDFPAGTTLASGKSLVLVPFDPTNNNMVAAFRTRYGMATSVTPVGPYSGHLGNAGDRVQLQRPDTPPLEEPTWYPPLLEDEVVYSPSWGGNTADNKSLHRVATDAWGDFKASWAAAIASPGTARMVAGQYVFYNNSAFDGRNPSVNSSDDAGIATDKSALLPGRSATFDNYTSYGRGLNAIMVDVANPPTGKTIGAADFEFRAGNDNSPAAWTLVTGATVTMRAGAGAAGSTRVVITWADDAAVKNRWLQVTVKATANTGLAGADVFYFGNTPGETGNHPTGAGADAVVDASDESEVRSHHSALPAATTNPYDFNRDRRVNATDELIARGNDTSGGSPLQLIDLTASGQSAAGGAAVSLATAAAAGGAASMETAECDGSREAPARVDAMAGLAPSATASAAAVSAAAVPAGAPKSVGVGTAVTTEHVGEDIGNLRARSVEDCVRSTEHRVLGVWSSVLTTPRPAAPTSRAREPLHDVALQWLANAAPVIGERAAVRRRVVEAAVDLALMDPLYWARLRMAD